MVFYFQIAHNKNKQIFVLWFGNFLKKIQIRIKLLIQMFKPDDFDSNWTFCVMRLHWTFTFNTDELFFFFLWSL